MKSCASADFAASITEGRAPEMSLERAIEDQRLMDVGQRHAVVEVAQRAVEHPFGIHRLAQPGTGVGAQAGQFGAVERLALVAVLYMDQRHAGQRLGDQALAGPALAVEHVGPRHVMLAGAHQGQFDLVLDILDMHRAAVGQATGQRADNRLRQMRDDIAHPRRNRALATFDGQEGLGQRDCDLVGIEGDDRAVAADDLQGGGSDFATGGQAQDIGLQGDSPYRGAENRRCGQPEIDAPNHRRGSQPVVESARQTNDKQDTR